ncbi:hypothetical protein [Streptomyces sp. S1]|uniref:hypothetical protein n=1 Tax=Streptomyces sp. S1 TaxID=718288 RepID=UPI003D75068C
MSVVFALRWTSYAASDSFRRTPVCTLAMAEPSREASAAAFTRSYSSKAFAASAVETTGAGAGVVRTVTVPSPRGGSASEVHPAASPARRASPPAVDRRTT